MANKMLGKKYELLEELGRGGFGTVYRARDTSLEVERAVKVLHSVLVASPEFIERFRREARVSARLDHPNIVPVYEFGEEEGGAYFLVMKYLPGGSLKDVLKKTGRLPFERAVKIARQVANALEYAWSQPEKLIHRDIKPGNILFEADSPAGTGGAARLADFGFAKALAGDDSSSLSASGGMIGTPPYMPPEVWRYKEFTPATDVYSLGCVFFEMVTGEVLFHGDSPADIMTMHVLDGPQFPEKWPEGVPEGIETVLGKALARNPKERYQSMGEFVSMLEQMTPTEAIRTQPVRTVPQAAPLVSNQEATQEKASEAQESIRPGGQAEAPQPAMQVEDELVSSEAGFESQPEETVAQPAPAPISAQKEMQEQAGEAEAHQVSPQPEKALPQAWVPLSPASCLRDESGGSPTEKKPKRKFPVWAIILIVLAGIVGIVLLFPEQSPPSQPVPTSTQEPAIPVILPTGIRPAVPVLLPTGTRPISYATQPAIPVLLPTGTRPAAPGAAQPAAPTSPVALRWFIGIGTGADPLQVTVEQSVVDDFNASHKTIRLSMEIVPNASARDTLSTEIAAGDGPDVVGPIGSLGSNAFGGQWLNIAPYLQSTAYDTGKFEAALMKMYQTDEGTVSLPFAVYPSAIYYNTRLFTEAGLNPPPANYGDQYTMPNGAMADWSWDTLTQVAKLLTIDSSGRHSGEAGFNPNGIVQYGFSFGWEGHPNYWGAFMFNGGQLLVPGGSRGSYTARIPAGWKASWKWVYDGIWGAQPYIPNGAVSGGADYDSGNVFASGKVAMLDNPSWYLCCLGDLTKAGYKFDFGAMPSNNGAVAGRVDADTFRIWKGSKHPAQAFTILAYLIDTGIQKLVVGTPDKAPAYGAIPSQTSLRGPWLAAQKANFPFVRNWNVLLAGLNYPDVPSAEGYMPNINEAWTRVQTFGDLLVNTKGINLAAQEAALESDLTVIFNK